MIAMHILLQLPQLEALELHPTSADSNDGERPK